MAGRAQLRASDADRDGVAERLRQAGVEGRLLTEELEERLEAALTARTYGQLDAVVSDLPGRRPSGGRDRRWAHPVIALAIAVPLLLLATIAIALAVTGVLAGWWLWLLVAWFVFGRHGRRRFNAMPPYGPGRSCGRGRTRQLGPERSRAYWA